MQIYMKKKKVKQPAVYVLCLLLVGKICNEISPFLIDPSFTKELISINSLSLSIPEGKSYNQPFQRPFIFHGRESQGHNL